MITILFEDQKLEVSLPMLPVSQASVQLLIEMSFSVQSLMIMILFE